MTIINRIRNFFSPKTLRMEFVKYDVSIMTIPREHRESLLKIFNNIYFEKLESFATTDSDSERLKRMAKAEQILEVYNMIKTANINEDQKTKLDIEKEERRRKKEGSFLFG